MNSYYISLEAGYFEPAVVRVNDGIVERYGAECLVEYAHQAKPGEVEAKVADGILIPITDPFVWCTLDKLARDALSSRS